MQAIVTKYICPTNLKGSRVKATCQAGSITLHWDEAFNPEQNHRAAAEGMATKLNWHGSWVGGGMPDGSMAWVDTSEDRACFTLKCTPCRSR